MDIYKNSFIRNNFSDSYNGIKDQVPVFTVVISIITGILIILYILPQIKEIVLEIENLIDYAGIPNKYIIILLKVIGISYISIFSSEICKDFGQANISEKIKLSGKILIICCSIPVISDLVGNILLIL